MLEQLAADPLWADEYDKFVNDKSFTKPDEVCGRRRGQRRCHDYHNSRALWSCHRARDAVSTMRLGPNISTEVALIIACVT
jgi:hypothetical protein